VKGPLASSSDRFPCHSSFLEVVPEERLVWKGLIHDYLEAHTTVTFVERNGKTTLTVDQVYSAESPATRGAPIGWGQTLDHLAAFVAKL
jgi:uncharacterized protein YndB with AHSA1/START domain